MSAVRTADAARPAARFEGEAASPRTGHEAGEQRASEGANTIESERECLRAGLDSIAKDLARGATLDSQATRERARRRLDILYRFGALQAIERGDADSAAYCDRVALSLSDPTGALQRHAREMFFVMLFVRSNRRPLERWRMLCPTLPTTVTELEVMRVAALHGIASDHGQYPRTTAHELELFRRHGITASERLVKATRNDVREWAPLGAALTDW